jgi:hypothetical protein
MQAGQHGRLRGTATPGASSQLERVVKNDVWVRAFSARRGLNQLT